MKKALVCGAGGFIGSHLVKKLKGVPLDPAAGQSFFASLAHLREVREIRDKSW